MPAPNANPSNCGAVSVACCPNRIPEVLMVSFSGGNLCGFGPNVYLTWNGSSWVGTVAGCGSGAFTFTLTCSSTWGTGSLSITGYGGNAIFSVTGITATCDGPNGFNLAFTVQQTSSTCTCCSSGTLLTVTVVNGKSPQNLGYPV